LILINRVQSLPASAPENVIGRDLQVQQEYAYISYRLA